MTDCFPVAEMAKDDVPVRGKADSQCTSPAQPEEWLDLLGNGQLKKKVLKAGNGPDSRPKKGQNVRIFLKASLTDGTIVEEEPCLSFTLGDGDIFQALDLAILLMELNEQAIVYTDAKYAYGALGSTAPAVPPESPLILEVHLLEATDAPELELMSPWDKITLARKKCERGNMYYKSGDYMFAITSYGIALQITGSSSKVDISPKEEEELLDIKVKCLNNVAAAQLKLDHYDAALHSCVFVLTHQPHNIKALFYKGKVLGLQGKYTEAIKILKSALKLEPSNKFIHAELCQLAKKHPEQRNIEQAMYKKMLRIPSTSTLQKHKAKSSWSFSWKCLAGATAIAAGVIPLSLIIAARK